MEEKKKTLLMEDDDIASVANENRHFLKVDIRGANYIALYDPKLLLLVKL